MAYGTSGCPTGANTATPKDGAGDGKTLFRPIDDISSRRKIFLLLDAGSNCNGALRSPEEHEF